MNKVLVLLALLQPGLPASAQIQNEPGNPDQGKEQLNQTADTNSLLQAFKKGHVQGRFRYYFMATDNKAGLSDYYANAAGGGIKYETARFKGFQLGVSGFFIFNIGSADLSKPDLKTNQLNRYELGLFAVNNPDNKKDISRLEELYIKYNWKQSHITFGKQLVNTPFINEQDSRMRPTEVGGLYGEYNKSKHTRIAGGYLYEISPRSTMDWYSAGKSIGVYSQGVNPDGTKSDYGGNLTSKGIGLLNITHAFHKNFTIKINDVFVENILNTILWQADYNHLFKNSNKLVATIQHIRQYAVKNGGHDDPAKTYYPKGGQSQTFGGKLGWENSRWQTSLNYNRITANGRYLMPREWGREPFFTYLPRERNEGLGDVNAYVVKAGYAISVLKLKTEVGLGYFDLPKVTNYALNKYGLPSYAQLNIDTRYEFDGFLKGMEVQLLFVYKRKSGDSFDDDRYVINKVDLSLWSLMLNYRF